jgi:hypothetical protein
MSTNASRPDKTDGTNLPNDDAEQPVNNQLKAAIRGPDAKCGNGPAAVIAYAERHTTADFREAADALKQLLNRGDVVRTERGLQLVETDGGVPEGDAEELDRRAQAAARALLRYAEATGQRPEWLLTFERHRESGRGDRPMTDGGQLAETAEER